MKCAILQPSYIPWRGYFHQIQKSDVFVFYDDVQYDKHGWRNRNRIKTANGPTWLTIPVASKGNVTLGTPINAVPIVWQQAWKEKHLATLRQAYARSPYLGSYEGLLGQIYSGQPPLLADFTIASTITLCKVLGIERRFVRSSELTTEGQKTDRLRGILRAVGATDYISGPAAKAYLDEDKLSDIGVSVEYMNYEYPEYDQPHPPYDPHVSILDLLFMRGPDAGALIW